MKSIVLLFTLFVAIYAQSEVSGMGQAGIEEVKTKVQTIEDKMKEVEGLERKLLMNADNDMNEDAAKLGSSRVDRAKSLTKMKSELEQLQKIRALLPQLHLKMKQIIETLPKKEQFRLIRNMNLRHRFDLGTWQDTA
ncbi:hypothetical protein ENUP19_0097G0016 [Entamoeba nuttalli]|nr:hypothetical protein ENU1_177510 [Entamoeba nuttalli P19]EKE38064.1 hypothetical protein ENU1_177510 [Entamoeba nuttalli P19]|eukprot:XP_008859596.1 hypothetical protein ENU1_177510 [Entamoeba nuttalli P19]